MQMTRWMVQGFPNPDMARVALSLAYDGANWLGWQTQPQGRTLQDAFEAAAAQFLAHPVSTICAGRTDAGVHALSQIVHLESPARRSEESWVRGMNALLPASMAVQWACPVADDFHARFSALSRSYVYVVRQSRVRAPFLHGRVAWVPQALSLDAMRAAAACLLGEHDFSSFRSSQCQAASPIRTLYQLDICTQGDFYGFYLRANAFLHHMVRNLLGALLYVGMGRQPPAWMRQLLSECDRRRAPPTWTAAGLYLVDVAYPRAFGLPDTDWKTRLASLTGLRFGAWSSAWNHPWGCSE